MFKYSLIIIKMEYVRVINEVRDVRNINEMLQRRPRVIRERNDPFNMFDEIAFRNRYRLSKEAVRFVIDLIEERLFPQAGHENDISPALQVLITLRFYAKGCYQVELGKFYVI